MFFITKKKENEINVKKPTKRLLLFLKDLMLCTGLFNREEKRREKKARKKIEVWT
jgi:hypothetical protein